MKNTTPGGVTVRSLYERVGRPLPARPWLREGRHRAGIPAQILVDTVRAEEVAA